MSDYVFELNPDQYLYRANDHKCFFVLHQCKLPGKNKNLFLIGDAFLRHFYSVYDFDNDEISLGVNVHSKGKAQMYKPGDRPSVATQVLEKSISMGPRDVKEAQLPTDIDDVLTSQTLLK